jgi:alpha-glucosidase (family GH31 glycosyl hydrolase)
MKEGSRERIVYLPEGTWTGLWPMTAELVETNTANGEAIENKVEGENIRLKGGCSYRIRCGTERIPAFIRDGGCLALNLGANMKLGSSVNNQTSGYTNLCFYMAGETGEYHFADDEDNRIDLFWNGGSYEVKQLAGKLSYRILEKL